VKNSSKVPYLIAARWMLLVALLVNGPAMAEGAERPPNIDLTTLSLEELMDIEISLVSRKAEKVFEAAAAVFVLTQEDLRRSGVTSIPEALRLVPGMHVGRIDASKWAISARGFNGRFAQKLLVLIDGRSVYTPLFSGVYWEVQDVLLEDVARIEVIRGPGATLWGANAVNGIINIVTRDAQDTRGGLVVLGKGSEERGFGGVRFGGTMGEEAHFRVYGKFFARDRFVDASGAPGADDWEMLRGGFRSDWALSEHSLLTLQGDLYDGEAGQTLRAALLESPYTHVFDDEAQMRGRSLLGRWKRRFSHDADLALQVYYDRTEREEALMSEVRDTYDVDFQQRFALGGRQEVLYGLGYRFTRDETQGTFAASFDPASRSTDLFSAFLHDEVAVVEDRLRLMVGSKFEHNDYTGFEYQPGIRLLWTPHSRHAVWATAARALRIPSRADEEVRLVWYTLPAGALFPDSPFTVVVGQGRRDLKAEALYAFELGYRLRPTDELLLDMAGYFNVYEDLRTGKMGDPLTETSPEPLHLVLPFYAVNLLEAETYGAELAADWRVVGERWRLRAAYTFLEMDLRIGPGVDPRVEGAEEESPEHQLTLWSALNLGPNLQLDMIVRYVDRLPYQDNDAYIVADVRLGWEPVEDLEISLVGRNLFEKRHPEFRPFFVDIQPTETEHEAYGAIRWRF